MPTVAAESAATLPVIVEPDLTKAVLASVNSALSMCDVKARCVGVASVPGNEAGKVTGMIGVHGKVSGFITVNLSERFAIQAVQGLLQEQYEKLTSQVVDGVGEITNIIVGGVKSLLGNTPWGFSHITVPSVIVGKGYHIAYARGLTFVCTTFEIDDPEAFMLEDRLMQVSLSFLRL
jgi:chemotaxis protein CheX